MKRIDYLKFAIHHSCFSMKAWMFSAFAQFNNPSVPPEYTGALRAEPWGLSFINDKGERERIEDSKPNVPLFQFSERLVIDPSWAINCDTTQETSIGTLLYNHICLIHAFGKKIPYIAGQSTVKQAEAKIAATLTDTPLPGDPRKDTVVYVDEYMKYGQGLEYLKGLMTLCAYSSTPKGIIPPTGLKEFKAGLLKKYEGQLTDPVRMAAFEAELLAFDAEFMKDDPTYGKFTSGKIAKTARKKLFLTVGAENSFGESSEITPIPNSLNEGWPMQTDQYVTMMNGIRVSSYARGAETVNGGVAAKILLRAANNFVIGTDRDCGSKLGIRRLYTESNKDGLEGRTIIDGTKQILVTKETALGNYLGKVLTVRSPMFCKSKGQNICQVCAGEKLARYKTGVTIPLMEISSIILASSMAKMHNSGVSTARLVLSEIAS